MQRRHLDIAQLEDHLTRLVSSRRLLTSRSAAMVALRVALAVVYIWFGILKLAGDSPAKALVEATLPWPTPGWLVPALGALEILIGIIFLMGRYLLWLLPLFVAHMIGTFGVLVMAPQLAFSHHDPAALTFTGEFVVKNLVLLSAGILVCLDSVVTRQVPRTVRIPVNQTGISVNQTVRPSEPTRSRS